MTCTCILRVYPNACPEHPDRNQCTVCAERGHLAPACPVVKAVDPRLQAACDCPVRPGTTDVVHSFECNQDHQLKRPLPIRAVTVPRPVTVELVLQAVPDPPGAVEGEISPRSPNSLRRLTP